MVNKHAVLKIFWCFQMTVIVNEKMWVKNTNSVIPLKLMSVFTKKSEMYCSCTYTRAKQSLVSKCPWDARNVYDALLKEHNPVNAHASYFDFPTGCRKFKRRKKLYRTFKIHLHRAQLSSVLP